MAPSNNFQRRVARKALALAGLGSVYDGTKPAPGTTNTSAWLPIDAPYTNTSENRSIEAYNNVLNQFAVGVNPRYTQRDAGTDGKTDTFCNIFVWDVTRAMGAEIPHWVDANGNPGKVGKPNTELNANRLVDWMVQHSSRFGWREVSEKEAQDLANQGHPVMAGWKNPSGIGHVAMVRPGKLTTRGPTVAQAGGRNFNYGYTTDGFGSRPVTYWANAPKSKAALVAGVVLAAALLLV